MIVASHQPNFMPYMGYVYKMYLCDVFTLSDTVQFSKQGFHNYNFFNEAGERKKITVPVSIKNGQAIREATLSDWEHNKVKLKKRLEGYYAKSPYFKSIFPCIEPLLTGYYKNLTDLNFDLLIMTKLLFNISCELKLESDLDIKGLTASEQIVDICKKTGCGTYLSGDGAKEYLDTECLKNNGIDLIWANYKPLEYGSVPNASLFDYLMFNGPVIPDSWKYEKEKLHNGKNL